MGLFHSKIENRGALCSLGFLVCTEEFAETVTKEMLRHSRKGPLVVPINGSRLRDLIASTDRNELLQHYVIEASVL